MLSSAIIQSHAFTRRRGNDVAPAVRLRALAFVIALSAALAIGCQTTKPVKLPVVVGENPTTAELLDAINKNSEKIQALYSTDASLSPSGHPGSANCRVFFLRPNKLRLLGSSPMTGRVIDAGCDGEKFWFWNKLFNGNELYSCKLSEYDSSRLGDVIPVDPSWFPEFLGVVEIKPEDLAEEPKAQSNGVILITAKKTRPDGVYLKRIYVEPRTAAIKRQDIQNPKGEAILTVECNEQQFIEEQNVVLPRKLEIRQPGKFGSVIIDLGKPTLNDPSKIEDALFQMPTDTGATVVDLGGKNSTAQKSKPGNLPATTTTPPAKVARTDDARNWKAPVDVPSGAQTGNNGLVAFPNGQTANDASIALSKQPDLVMPSQTIASTGSTNAVTSATVQPVDPNRYDSAAQPSVATSYPTVTVQSVVYDRTPATNVQSEPLQTAATSNLVNVPETSQQFHAQPQPESSPVVFAPPSLSGNANLATPPQSAVQTRATATALPPSSTQGVTTSNPSQATLNAAPPVQQPVLTNDFEPTYPGLTPLELAAPQVQTAPELEQIPVGVPPAPVEAPQPNLQTDNVTPTAPVPPPADNELDDEFPMIPF